MRRPEAVQAVRLGRKMGTPVYVLKNGRIVDLTEEWKQRSQALGQQAAEHERLVIPMAKAAVVA